MEAVLAKLLERDDEDVLAAFLRSLPFGGGCHAE